MHMREWIRSYSELNNVEFIILPFGKNGRKTKEILNKEFNIKELCIIDDFPEQDNINNEIVRTNELKNFNNENIVFLLSTTCYEFNKELNDKIVEICPLAKIANILKPAIVYKNFKTDYFNSLKEILKTQKVVTTGDDFIRIGKENDGGYIMLNHFSKDVKAYSFGIANDVSWDRAFVDYTGGESYMYDHTIDRLPEYNEHFHWKKIGIGGGCAFR